ncbi:MAG TPA: hypothetical protein VFN57_15780 [Thermomicrobiaceae bacterium]|nr:hypothetical protein [Thermomicrobiaceae bacterium]
MGTWGYVILVAGAVVIGALAQYGLRARLGLEGVLTAIAAGVAGFAFSEYEIFGLGKWGYEAAGLAIFPALIAALVAAAIVEVGIHYVEQGARA